MMCLPSKQVAPAASRNVKFWPGQARDFKNHIIDSPPCIFPQYFAVTLNPYLVEATKN